VDRQISVEHYVGVFVARYSEQQWSFQICRKCGLKLKYFKEGLNSAL